MLEPLVYVPPAFAFALAAALAVATGPRLGAAGGLVAGGYVSAWTLAVPSGTYGAWQFLEFTVVPVAVAPASRTAGLAFALFGTVAVGYLAATGGGRLHVGAALGYVSGAVWAVFAGDWLGLLVGWELMALVSTVLVWLHGGRAVRIGFRYALVHAIGGATLAAGLAMHAVASGLGPSVLHFDGGITPGLPAVAVGIGVGINAAVFGVHVWLPDTYASPHVGASVVLSAYTTKLSVYAAYRAFPDGQLVLAYIGGVMAITGAGYAILQKDARRLLAYHIQAQVGYLLAGVGIGSSLGLVAAMAHLFNNILFKGLLFMVAGLFVLRAGTGRLDKGGTIGRQTPVLTGSFLIAAASITGLPGTNGFVSKGMVMDAAAGAGYGPLRWLLLAGAIGTIISFCKFGYYALFKGDEPLAPATVPQAATMIPVAVGCLLLGVWYGPFLQLLPAAGDWSVTPYTGSKLIETAVLFAVGGGLFVLSRPLLGRVHGGIDVDAVRDPLAFGMARAAVAGVATALGTFARIESGVHRRLRTVLVTPSATVAAWLPAPLADRYRVRMADAPGTVWFTLAARYRALLLVGCLAVAFLVGVVGQ